MQWNKKYYIFACKNIVEVKYEVAENRKNINIEY